MRKSILITLGRLPKCLDLARAFHGAGWRVVVAEPFNWHLTRVSNAVARAHRVTAPRVSKQGYLDDLARIVADERIDLVVPVSEETMHVSRLKDRPGFATPVYCMPHETVVRLHDKRRFIELAAGLGLDVPETAAADAPEAAGIAASGDFIVKPVFSCSGRGVRFLTQGEPVPDETFQEPSIVQRRVHGDVRSTFTIAHQGRVIVTSVYRGVVMSGTVAVAFERVADMAAIEAWVARFVEGTGYSGFISFDFVVDGEGRPFAIECNPRVTSGIHFLRPGAVVQAMLEPEKPLADPFREERLFQQFFPCLTETQGAMFRRGRDFGRKLDVLRRAKDVTWSPSDPLPLLTMTPTSYEILALSIFKGMTLGDAATQDIVWYPDQAAAGA